MKIEEATLADKLTAISGYYRNPDGTPCSTLAEVEELPEFKELYPAALKTERDDSTAAKLNVINSLLEVQSDLSEAPCWLLNADDYDREFKGTARMDAEGNLVRGVRIVLPSGDQRFLRNADAAGMKPGQPCKLKGSIKHVRSLLPGGREHYRIGKESSLVAEPHDEPFPHLGLESVIGERVRNGGWGPYATQRDRGVLRGEFGPTFRGMEPGKEFDNYNEPLYFTARFGNCAWTDEDKGTLTVFLTTHDGFDGMAEISMAKCVEHYGVSAGSDPEAYTEALRGQWILSRGAGNVLRRVRAKQLGEPEDIEREVAEARGLGWFKPFGAKGTELLVIPPDIRAACKAAEDFPSVEFCGHKVHDIRVKSSGFVEVYELPLDKSVDFAIEELRIQPREGDPFIVNNCLWWTPLENVNDTGRRVDPSDPALAELRALGA